MRKENCPICLVPETGHSVLIDEKGSHVTHVDCLSCGRYQVRTGDEDLFARQDPDRALLPYLSAYIRQTWERDNSAPTITRANWRDLAESVKAVAVPQCARKLLEVIASRTTHAGDSATVNQLHDLPLVGAFNHKEFEFLLNYLAEQHLIKQTASFRY